jgi:hypothetical protein
VNRLRDFWFDRWPWVVGIALGALIIAMMIAANVSQAAWNADCEARGGHVESSTQTGVGTGVSANGKPVVTTTTSTTHFCLSSDGRILKVS